MTKWYLLVDRFANTIVLGKERWLSDTCWLTGVPTSTQRSSYRCSQSTDGISQVYVVVWAWSSNAVTTCELCHCYFFSLSWRAYILLWLSVNMMDFHPITCVWYLLTPVVYESLVTWGMPCGQTVPLFQKCLSYRWAHPCFWTGGSVWY